MTTRPAPRVLMALAGAALIGAGLISAPAAGGAITDGTGLTEPDLSTSSSVELPEELDPVISGIEKLTGSTVTTSSTTTTSTTTTTTTVPDPDPEPEPEGDETENEADDDGQKPLIFEPEPVGDFDIPVVDVEELKADYIRTEFPAYTPRFGKRSTLSVVELLRSHDIALDVQAQVLAPFPVNGPASYTDDWGAARFSPSFHLHEGIDIFAERGTPVIASTDGTVTRTAYGAGAGGNVVYLEMDDGTYFYYAHLDGISPVIHAGTEIEAGTVLGTVGNSGNAVGTPPHLHFEIHPGGGDAVPPAPYVDAWLADAMEEAEALVGAGDTSDGATRAPVPLPGRVEQTQNAGISSLGDQNDWGNAAVQWLMILVPSAAFWFWRRRRTALAGTLAVPEIQDDDRDLTGAST